MSRTLLNKTTRVGEVNPVAGSAVDAGSYIDMASLQVSGAGAQSTLVTVSTATTGDYVLSIGEDSSSLVTVTYTSASSTDSVIAAGIADAINAKVGVSSLVFASSFGAIVGLQGRQKGAFATFSVSTSDAKLTVGATTSPVDATAISFGTFCESSSATRPVGTINVAAACGTGTYVGQVVTSEDLSGKSITTGDTVNFIVSGDFDGRGVEEYAVNFPFHTGVADTLTDAAAALNSMFSASGISVAEASGVFTFTADNPGVGFTVSGSYGVSGTYTATTFTTGIPNTIPNGGGVALQSHAIEQDEDGVTKYTNGSTVSAMQSGKVYVLLDAGVTVSIGDPVWVRHNATGTEVPGAFRTSADGTDAVPLTAFGFKGSWLSSQFTDMDGNNVAPLYITRG